MLTSKAYAKFESALEFNNCDNLMSVAVLRLAMKMYANPLRVGRLPLPGKLHAAFIRSGLAQFRLNYS